MAADSDGTLKAVVICEGDLHDPEFPRKLKNILGKLKTILEQPKAKKLKVNKVEPWNSVRVTLSIPKEAAIKLRQLAAEGSHALRALGILSVQLEGDTVISLRLAGQEIVIRTDNITSQETVGLGELNRILSQPQPPQQSSSAIPNTNASSSSASSSYLNSASGIPSSTIVNNNIISNEPIAGPSSSINSIVLEQTHTSNHISQQNGPIFKSPNTVCPMDGKLPVHVPNNTTNSTSDNCEYPFESMIQARVIQRRENTMSMATTVSIPGVSNTSGGSVQFVAPPPPPHHHPPPPPYSSTLNINTNNAKTPSSPQSVGGNIAITSPLLVNLLQNEGSNGVNNSSGTNIVQAQQTTTSSTMLQIKPNVKNINSKDNHELLTRSEDELIVNNCNKIMLNKQHAKQTLDNNLRHSTVLQHNILQTGPMSSATVTSAPPPVTIPQTTGQMMLINSGGNNAGGQINSSNSSSLSNVPSTINISNNNSNIKTRFIGPQTQQQTQQQSLINIRNVNPANFQMPVPNQSHHSNVQQYRYQLQHAQQQHPHHMQQFRHPSPAPVMPQNNNNSSNSTFPPPPPPPSNNNSNTFTPRWPLKPMDSATKSSYQEFARYQMQYNLSQQQQQMQQNYSVRGNNNNNPGTGGGADLFSLDSDLAELSKNDLDSLLPTLSASELDSELGLDGKTPLEALLLDTKDLDLDLIDQQNIIAPNNGSAGRGIISSNTNVVSSLGTGVGKSVPNKQKQMLINPLTGELEPMPSEESSSEAEMDEINFQEFNSEISNSLYSDDDNSCSTGFSKTTSDQSDTERSNMSDTSSFNKSTKGRKTKDRSKVVKRERNTQSKTKDKSNATSKDSRVTNRKNSSERKMDKSKSKIIASSSIENSDKIKLRLKLEKSEPVNSAYKVDVSFVHSQSPKRALSSQSISQLSSSSSMTGSGNILNSPNMSHLSSANQISFASPSSTSSSSSISVGSSQQSTVQQSPAGEELRVPPLHIRLRGENSVVIKNSKKDRKKSSSMPSNVLTNQSSSSNNNSNSSGNIGLTNFGGSAGTSLLNAMGTAPNLDDLTDNSNLKKISSGLNKTSHHHNKMNNTNHNELINRKSVNNSNSMDYFDESNASLLQNRPSLIIEKIQNKSDSNISSFHGEKDSYDSIIKSISPSTSQQQQTILNSSSARDNPNGIINCPEKKRKLSNSLISLGSTTIGSSATSMANSNINITNLSENNDDYIHIKGPIGSTNVGTIPQHSSMIQTKNQKGVGSNSLLFNNKINKTAIIKTGKPIIKNLIKPILLPQTNIDGINEEKFKQKLLENTSVANPLPSSITSSTVSTPTTCSTTNSNSNTNTPHSQPSQQHQTQTHQSTANDNYNNNNDKINNSTNYNKEINTDLSKKIEINHSSRPPEKLLHQQQNPNRCSNPADQINAMPVVQQRGSPNSQAQGEDSGIESMDALSEKSPNQLTQSPQDDNKHSPNNLNDNSSSNTKNTGKMMEDFSSIDLEAALADMEGIIPTQNLNGDHSTIVTSSNEQHTSNESIITKSNDTLLNELMMTPNNDEIENKDIKIDFDDDECCNTKLELNLENSITSKLMDIKDNTKQEQDTFSSSTSNSLSQSFNVGSDVKDVKDSKQILQQLSIEIPSHEDQNLPRVRTRASSKLESPLDPSKQSPSIDSPASCLNKAGLKLSQAAIDRLSPKISKPGKRKRQESESSTQSCVSDDTPGRSKKIRKSTATSTTTNAITSVSSSAALSVSNVNSLEKASHAVMQNKKVVSSSETPAKHITNCNVKSHPISITNAATTSTVTLTTISAPASTTIPSQVKKGEDSSDSDEPLSEIANNKAKKIKPTVGHTTISNNSTVTSTSTSNPSDSDKMSKGQKAALPSITLPNVTTSLVTSLITSTVTNIVGTPTTPPVIVTSPTTPIIRNLSVKIQSCDDKISTRRSVRMTNINYAKSGHKQQINVGISNVTTPGGTTVPTSPNIIGAGVNVGADQIKPVNQQFIQTKTGSAAVGGSISGGATVTLSSEQTTEARRKTRSAGLDASTEGRRRRGSRDVEAQQQQTSTIDNQLSDFSLDEYESSDESDIGVSVLAIPLF